MRSAAEYVIGLVAARRMRRSIGFPLVLLICMHVTSVPINSRQSSTTSSERSSRWLDDRGLEGIDEKDPYLRALSTFFRRLSASKTFYHDIWEQQPRHWTSKETGALKKHVFIDESISLQKCTGVSRIAEVQLSACIFLFLCRCLLLNNSVMLAGSWQCECLMPCTLPGIPRPAFGHSNLTAAADAGMLGNSGKMSSASAIPQIPSYV